MTETEAPVLSFKDRIAKFNQSAETPPVPRPQSASRPPPPVHNKTINNPPNNVNGSVLDRSIGNQPADPGPKPSSNGVQKPVKVPPPLPSRKASMTPALPRRPSADPSLHHKNSLESVTSDASLSTASTRTGRTTVTSSTSADSGNGRIRAPAWGEAELPPLPPRRGKSPIPPPRTPSRPPSSASRETEGPPPKLPLRPGSSASNSTDGSRGLVPPPQLPPRRPSYQEPAQNANEDTRPQLPTRRKLPPPLPPTDARHLGFSGLKRDNETPSNGAPPPVPRGSRPDLSAIQATKPSMHSSHPSYAAPPSTECLKCRDFSGPDTHATRYPRQSLPSQNIPWLANELTAPFLSHTDKARVLFTWLHHNIEYDVYSFFNKCVKPSTPASTLSTGLAVCEGYAALFATLATHAGLEAIVVSGHGKGIGFADPAPGSSLPPFSPTGHAWNVVRIDNGQWKLIDPCWGAGAVQGFGQPYMKRFDPSQFTKSNDEFGISHYPANQGQFYRDDGRPSITWEEYILGNPNSPLSAEQPTIFSDADKHSIGPRTYHPASKKISIHQPGLIRFQFGLICEHWTLQHHSKTQPGLFLLIIHGVDGRQDERLPFNHVRGAGPAGGGEYWYVDVPDARMLGAPGQVVQIAVLTSFGDRKDARGLTVQEYQAQAGRVGMAWAYVAQWDLV